MMLNGMILQAQQSHCVEFQLEDKQVSLQGYRDGPGEQEVECSVWGAVIRHFFEGGFLLQNFISSSSRSKISGIIHLLYVLIETDRRWLISSGIQILDASFALDWFTWQVCSKTIGVLVTNGFNVRCQDLLKAPIILLEHCFFHDIKSLFLLDTNCHT